MFLKTFALILVLVGAVFAVDINVAEDEARKVEETILTPMEGEGYYDSAALAELALARARRSPTGAMWRSLAIPAWGQIYNGKIYKAPAVIGAEGTTLFLTIKNYRLARSYHEEARAEKDPKVRSNLYEKYNETIITTEFWGWLFVGTLTYAMMDAYVDAHLADWDVSDLPADKPTSSRWGLEVGPEGITLRVNF